MNRADELSRTVDFVAAVAAKYRDELPRRDRFHGARLRARRRALIEALDYYCRVRIDPAPGKGEQA